MRGAIYDDGDQYDGRHDGTIFPGWLDVDEIDPKAAGIIQVDGRLYHADWWTEILKKRITMPRWCRCVIIFSIAAILGAVIVTIASSQEAEDIAEVIVEDLQAIRYECLDCNPSFCDGACRQGMARDDYLRGWGRNWSSRDYQNGRGSYRGFDLCNGPTEWAGRGLYQYREPSGVLKTVIRQRVSPALAAALIDEHRMYFDQVHCYQDSFEVAEVFGAYAKAFIPTGYEMGAFPTDTELRALAELPPIDEWHPAYWGAYAMVEPVTPSNPHTPGSAESDRYAWDNREAVFALMADGPFRDRHARVEVWNTAAKLSEWVILFAAHVPEDWGDNRGNLVEWAWPLWYSDPVNEALDWIYQSTSQRNDPGLIFRDIDVMIVGASWGGVKATFR